MQLVIAAVVTNINKLQIRFYYRLHSRKTKMCHVLFTMLNASVFIILIHVLSEVLRQRGQDCWDGDKEGVVHWHCNIERAPKFRGRNGFNVEAKTTKLKVN